MINLIKIFSLYFIALTIAFEVSSAQKYFNTITLINSSGENAFVKVVGPTELQVQIPKNKNQILNVSAGKYYILVRYGTNTKNFTYIKGEPFKIEQNDKEYTAIEITLSKNFGGNYGSSLSTSDEFNQQNNPPDSGKEVIIDNSNNPNDPGLKTNELLVTSIPLGLKIYFAMDTDTIGTRKKVNSLRIETSHPLLDTTNFKGLTPVILGNIKPGKYLLGIEPVEILDNNLMLCETDESLQITSLVSDDIYPTKYSIGKKGMTGSVIYSVVKDDTTGERLIILSLPHELPISKMQNYYPEKIMFAFNDNELKKEIKSYGFKEKEIRIALDLLHRGGKIRLNGKDKSLFIEIQNNGSWKIGTLSRDKGTN